MALRVYKWTEKLETMCMSGTCAPGNQHRSDLEGVLGNLETKFARLEPANVQPLESSARGGRV